MAEFNPELESLVRELNKQAPTGAEPSPRIGPAPTAAPAPPKPLPASAEPLDKLLYHAIERGASDVVLVAGCSAVLRVSGSLIRMEEPPLSDEAIRGLMMPLLGGPRREELESRRSCDFSFVREGVGRFRTNVHFQRGTLAVAIRILPALIPTLETLNLPRHLSKLVERKQGLILVTGPTGSGKTSTQAALMGLVNDKYPYHVVTIEDPIEYYHTNRQSIFEQIEIGHDADDFAGALRSVLRQNPDVILVGEMRDPETTSTVLTAAETGHLVLSTLHTNDAIQALGRIVDLFPTGRQGQIRQQLSLGLLAIIAQQLVPSADGTGRYPAVEILIANTAVRHLIRKGEDHMLRSQLSLGRADGMVMMEQSLAELVQRGAISEEAAGAHCFRDDELRRYLVG
jgi:twitching motility protein PilT